jgi:hypothetical protein
MTRWLATAALAAALGASAMPAQARTIIDAEGRIDWNARSYESAAPRRYERGDEEPAYRPQRRQRNVAPRRSRQHAAKRRTPPASVADRGLKAYAQGGTARNCLRPAARTLLERIEAQFGPMQIISTCRPGARIAGTGRISKHASGEAIDFNAGGRKGEVVRWLIANHKSGGVMTYAGMSHIHVDVGYHFVALNSGGRR